MNCNDFYLMLGVVSSLMIIDEHICLLLLVQRKSETSGIDSVDRYTVMLVSDPWNTMAR